MRALWVGLAVSGGCSENRLENISKGEGIYNGVLEADPGAVRFGDIELDGSATEMVTITSVGDEPVTLFDAAIIGDGTFSMNWNHAGRILNPADSIDVAITYYPASLDDSAQLIVSSDAVDDELFVPISGAVRAPALTITPSPALFEAMSDGLPVTEELTIENVGTALLSLEEQLLIDDGNFTILSSPIPTSLEVGETTTMLVEYLPDATSEEDLGELWVTSNAPSSPTLVPLIGTLIPPCLGLSEAWGRGMLDLYSQYGSSITIENISEDYNICVDRWYVYMGIETQDAIGGDPLYDPGAEYPLGTITIPPGEVVQLQYAEPSDPAWWCVEQTQVTNTTYNFMFIGARAPTPLLDLALGTNNQDLIWAYQNANPAVAIGRSTHYAELIRNSPSERVANVEIQVINIGQADVDTLVYETIPAGFSATSFSQSAVSITEESDGAITYAFEVDLDARVPTKSRDQHTLYDRVDISYVLTLDAIDDCLGRVDTLPPRAVWTDIYGDTYTSSGSPMVLDCR
jgi:hypothetical protein